MAVSKPRVVVIGGVYIDKDELEYFFTELTLDVDESHEFVTNGVV